jgi:hypothetical protein
MRRCQYVVQRLEGVRRRHGSTPNTSIAAQAICLFFNTLINACPSTIGEIAKKQHHVAASDRIPQWLQPSVGYSMPVPRRKIMTDSRNSF